MSRNFAAIIAACRVRRAGRLRHGPHGVPYKLVKKTWVATGRDGLLGKANVDDDNANGIDDPGEIGLYEDGDKNDVLWKDNGSTTDRDNNGW